MWHRFFSYRYRLATAFLLSAEGAFGAPTPENAEAATPTLWVQVTPGPSHLEPETVRVAIEKELGVATSSSPAGAIVGRVLVEGGTGTSVTVRYESADGTTKLERVVSLPIDARRRALVIAWVTGNLVRNEAAEILSGMKGRRRTENAADAGDSNPVESESAAQPDNEAPVVAPPSQPVPPTPELPKVLAHPVTSKQLSFAVASGTAAETDLGPTRFVHAALVSPWIATDPEASQHRYHLNFGGFYSHVGAISGFGFGWLVDRIDHSSKGLQLSTLWIHGAAMRGVFLAGLGTSAVGDLHGTEIAGAVTWRAGNVEGVQLSGALNVARDVQGLQLSSVNVARDVEGLQLGFVNVARRNSGFSVGLFNWSEGARVQPTYFFQNPGYHSVGYRNLSGHAVSAISFGYDEGRKRARTRFAVGARTTVSRFALGVETGYGWVLEHMTSGPTDRAHELELIGTVTVEVIPRMLSLYGGGGVALPVSGAVPIEPKGLAQAGISLL